MGMYKKVSNLSYGRRKKRERYEAKHPDKVRKIVHGGLSIGAGAGAAVGMAKSGAAAVAADVVSDVVLATVATPVAPIIKKAVSIVLVAASFALGAASVHKVIQAKSNQEVKTEIEDSTPSWGEDPRDGRYQFDYEQ